ncbi:MAG: trypsin-like peptidase domain-containing protein [Candidatus Dojkabacteria bacterium]|nr:MAG: trypsin-like peptidase domain-containing protein [Candidatus Dojkabacteria bacterium]
MEEKKSNEVPKIEKMSEKEIEKGVEALMTEEVPATVAAKSKPRRGNRLARMFMGCIFVIFFLLCIFAVGSALGFYYYPRLYPRFGDNLERLGIELTSRDAPVEIEEEVSEFIPGTSEEELVVNVVEESMPSVVTIAVSRVSFDAEEGVVDDSSNIGSGFIVDPSGLIITNQHVVADSTVEYKVITSDGQEYDVENIATDDANDIALLEVNATDLNAMDLGNSDSLVVGQTVVAIGTPLGEYAGSVTKGVVSGLNRSVETGSQSFFGTVKTYEDVIQTDASVNPGNSGGPLLNTQGEVVGVNFATTSGADNISFALPINRVKQRIDEYRKYGKFVKGYLGIQYEVVYDRNYNPLVLVVDVAEGSPAADAGVLRRDLITKIDGVEIDGSFVSILQSYKPGDKIVLTIVRDREEVEVEVTLGEA